MTEQRTECMDTTTGAKTENFNVAILLCSYNGEKHLTQQLESLQRQTHKNWTLYISDDGSSDSTPALISEFQKTSPIGKVQLFEGPRRGFAKNFISLLTRPDIQADYYAFCDQDDIWHNDKLARSLACLATAPSDRAAMYCSRTRLINETGGTLGQSPLYRMPFGFSNSLVQSIAGANTMVINQRTRELLNIDYHNLSIVAHDWLIYMIVTGSEGFVHYDPTPTLDYRQHAHNLIGSQSGFRLKIKRLQRGFSGRFRAWTDQNINVLSTLKNKLSAQNQTKLDIFIRARSSPFFTRLPLMKRTGIYRQTLIGNIGLFIAVVLNKI